MKVIHFCISILFCAQASAQTFEPVNKAATPEAKNLLRCDEFKRRILPNRLATLG